MKRDKFGRFIKGYHYSIKTEFKKGENLREKHLCWKGGRVKLKIGYIIKHCPNHPRASRGYVYEHILIAEDKIGRLLKKGEVVHHINGIRDDNRKENLIVIINNAKHMSLHRLKKWSRLYDKCKRCETNKTRHEAFGLCANCYKYNKYHNLK